MNIQVNGNCADPNSTYAQICKSIPYGLQNLDMVIIYTIDSLTQFYKSSRNSTDISNILIDDDFTKISNNKIFTYIIDNIINQYISPIFNNIYQYTMVSTLNNQITNLSLILLILMIIYVLALITLFIFYWIVFQNRIVVDIIYSKTTLLLIHPSDMKEIKPIMNFLKKEVYKLNSNA